MKYRFLMVLALAVSACGQGQEEWSAQDIPLSEGAERIWTRLHTPCPGKLRYLLESDGW